MLLVEIMTGWRRFIARIANPYRPELHYMRGPGPKWRAKHGQLILQPAPVRVRSQRPQRPWA